jgi:TonB family protein
MCRLAILVVASVLGLGGQVLVPGPEGDCGLSELHARQMAHFVDKGAVVKIAPQYPPAAKAKRIGGEVRIKIVVNKQGLVERTCPVYVRSERRPERSLVVAAEAAALHWTFKPNFGIDSAGGVRFDYVYDVVLFRFDPANQNAAPVGPQ